MKEWSEAKERLSVEISRKFEGQNHGTKFEKARGFVRKNFNTKNFDPKLNPLLEDTSSSSGEENDVNTVNAASTNRLRTGL